MLYLPGEFPLDPDLCYLNHAAIGPWPRRTAQVVANFAQQVMQRGGSDYPDWLQTEARLRERLARLVNVDSADDIALVKNTSEGLSIISQGLAWADGDVVVGLHGDFCSNQMAWQALADRGVQYRAVDALSAVDPEQALIDALEPAARLLAISTVHFATGYRFDMARLAGACRERGVLLSVDVIQSLGAVPFDQEAVRADFITCGGHKWLLSPEGQGFLYCRPSLRDQVRLHQYGWAMRASPYGFERDDWEVAPTARRFEAGTPNMLGIHGMDASLGLFEEIGMERVAALLEQNISLLEHGLRAIDGIEILSPSEPGKRAGILTFRHPACSGSDLHAALSVRNVICSPRAGGIRLSPHFYTPERVLQCTIEIISQTIQSLRK
ncbi:MAG: aminotransferase class V-fold PLP-dependent enzyme [Gammaproteobacteria bacterium]|nr:aminotransferase class V-fold PLP-dependent enzyme [Gammaproteobacteria bacterium]